MGKCVKALQTPDFPVFKALGWQSLLWFVSLHGVL
jgi:hypothetical protein